MTILIHVDKYWSSHQVVCSQAVSIACTEDLNANMTGFLPVNCVMQLLKAKSFSKYNIPLKVYIVNKLVFQ